LHQRVITVITVKIRPTVGKGCGVTVVIWYYFNDVSDYVLTPSSGKRTQQPCT